MPRIARLNVLLVFSIVAGLGLGAAALGKGDGKKDAKSPRHILIIRHAEKTGDKTDPHISKQGLQRADALEKLFQASPDRPEPFPAPDFIIAASNSMGSHRPMETVAPLARKLKLSVIDTYESKLPAPLAPVETPEKAAKGPSMIELRDALFSDPKFAGKTVLISWRHQTICELAKTLKAAKAPKTWSDDVFDRVWQITYDDQGNATFRDRPQRLLPGDARK